MAFGCDSVPTVPATAVRSMGTFDFASQEHQPGINGDVVVVFDPPDKFRIVGKVWGQRVFDIGGDGKVIWQVFGDQKQVYYGSITIDQTEPFSAKEKTFVPPNNLT